MWGPGCKCALMWGRGSLETVNAVNMGGMGVIPWVICSFLACDAGEHCTPLEGFVFEQTRVFNQGPKEVTLHGSC